MINIKNIKLKKAINFIMTFLILVVIHISRVT